MILKKGEVRQIGIEVYNQLGQDFIIANADYEIFNKENILISKGLATVDERKILTLFSAMDIGEFKCNITYRIGAEIIKANINVEVI